MHKSLTDNELDTLVVRSLSRLGTHAPSGGFSDRVMARVELPPGRAVATVRAARRWVGQPTRALRMAAAYAVVAVVALAFAVPWVLANTAALDLGLQFVLDRIGHGLREVTTRAAAWGLESGFAETLSFLRPTGLHWYVAAAGVGAAYASWASALHALLRSPRSSSVHIRP